MQKINWKNDRRKVIDLIPADYNPRKLTDKERSDLRESLDKFSLVDPIIINIGSRENTIIGGHQRIDICATLGIEEVDVRVPDRELSVAEETELNIRLNKNIGSWDNEKLLNFDKEFLKMIGWTKDELTKIFDNKNLDDDDFDVEAEINKIEPKAKYGEVATAYKNPTISTEIG